MTTFSAWIRKTTHSFFLLLFFKSTESKEKKQMGSNEETHRPLYSGNCDTQFQMRTEMQQWHSLINRFGCLFISLILILDCTDWQMLANLLMCSKFNCFVISGFHDNQRICVRDFGHYRLFGSRQFCLGHECQNAWHDKNLWSFANNSQNGNDDNTHTQTHTKCFDLSGSLSTLLIQHFK